MSSKAEPSAWWLYGQGHCDIGALTIPDVLSIDGTLWSPLRSPSAIVEERNTTSTLPPVDPAYSVCYARCYRRGKLPA